MLVNVTMLCKATYEDVIEVPDSTDDAFIQAYCYAHISDLAVNNLQFYEDVEKNNILDYQIIDI